MDQVNNEKITSRRDFLKKSLKTVGYSVPVIMAFSSLSVDAFACGYRRKRVYHNPNRVNHNPNIENIIRRITRRWERSHNRPFPQERLNRIIQRLREKYD